MVCLVVRVGRGPSTRCPVQLQGLGEKRVAGLGLSQMSDRSHQPNELLATTRPLPYNCIPPLTLPPATPCFMEWLRVSHQWR